MKSKILKGMLLVMLFTFFSCGKEKEVEAPKTETPIVESSEKVELTFSIAASVTKSMEEIIKLYEEENQGVTIKLNSGGSGALEQQIIGGAPVDIFLSASKKNMDNLEEKDFIEKETRKDLLKNELVLIGNKSVEGKIKSINELKGSNMKLAIGELTTVPAGKYGKQALEKLNLWNDVEKNIIYQKDVTAVLNIVNMDEIETGIVYYSDAMAGENIFIIESFPKDSHDPIVYPITILKDSKYKKEAEDFINFLSSDKAKEIFKKNGFSIE